MIKTKKQTISFDVLKNLTKPMKREKLYFLPIFSQGFTENEINKINMQDFLFPWWRNRDWYFAKKINDERCEEIKEVYFTKKQLNTNQFEYLDFIPEIDVYIFTKKND